MKGEEARRAVQSLFVEALSHLQVGPRLWEVVRLRDGLLQVSGDTYSLAAAGALRVVAAGKAANEMAHTLAEILAAVRLRGIVAAPTDPGTRLLGFDYFRAGHPYPNEQSWRTAEASLALLRNLTSNDIVFFLLSGGGSALLEMPLDPAVSPEELRRFHETLVTCGANIQAINTLRKHFSAVKGGRLAVAAAPARQITLYVSDVPDHLSSMVASGPTMPDESTLEDCRRVIVRYGLLEKFPASYRALWESGRLPETPKPGHTCFAQSRYYCLLSNRDGVERLMAQAQAKGVYAEADTRCDDWDFWRAADYLLARLESLRRECPGRPAAVISGGELSCPVTGAGVGGRNQAFVLYCVSRIAGLPVVVLSGGTDGIDGNSPACGAVADGESLGRARALGLDPDEFLRQADSFHFFEKLGDALITGPTGTNVRDLRILLAYS